MRCLNDHQIPNHAIFCPHCGAGVADKPFNNMLMHDLDERSDLDLESFEMPRRKTGLWLGLAALLVIGGAGLASSLNGTSSATPVAEAPVVAVSTPATTAAPVVVGPVFNANALKIELAPAFGTISYEGRTLVDVRTAVGSRYSTLDERTQSIEVRIRHAWETSASTAQKPLFAAVARGNIHEVVWTRAGETDFRVMDVTERDVRLWEKANGKTTRAILANLIADRLGAITEPPSNS
jgi:hypothetical protein